MNSPDTTAGVGLSAGERLYFIAVGALALWVGVWGYLIPAKVTRAIPFGVPPLHARFLGSVYLSGFIIMVWSTLAHRWEEVRDVPIMTAIWTGGLGLISLFHLDAFPFDRNQTWVWFGAYLVYPLIALLLAWRHKGAMEIEGASLPRWSRAYLLVQGIVFVLLAAVLLLAPGMAVASWPWPITRMLAQIYAAPLLSYGVGSLLLSRRSRLRQILIPIAGMLAFALLALLASALHLDLFSSSELPDIAWFGLLVVMSAALAALALRALVAGQPARASR